jgi:glycosyltransferase involved in cell wall biosynthesis
MRAVVTHDFFETFGGAERVTAEIAAAFPDAPVYAILGRHAVAERMGIGERVHTLLPHRPRLLDRYRVFAPLYPGLVKAAKLPEADVVIASSYAYAHGFATANRAPKLCYCHGPFRHLWSQQQIYAAALPGGPAARRAFDAYACLARSADRAAAGSVTSFLTQSPFTARLIERAYDRRAEVLPPPIDCDLFHPSGRGPGGYFLFVGRLVEAYKRPSLVIEAFSRLPGRRLLVAGDGPALASLRERATDNVEFLGQLDDRGLVEVMQGCLAAIFPSVDDFGLVPLEVNACGRPVLAVPAGGALHTVAPGLTGEFLGEQSSDAIVDAVRKFDPLAYDRHAIRTHARRWDRHMFRARIRALALSVAGGTERPAARPEPTSAPAASAVAVAAR